MREREIGRVRLWRVGASGSAPRLVMALEDGAGRTGLGEAAGDEATFARAAAEAGRILGENPFDRRAAHACEPSPTGASSRALDAALSIALWDLKARQLDVPLYRLLGGRPLARVPVAATIDLGGTDPCAAAIEAVREGGYGTLVARARDIAPAEAIDRLATIRAALGEGVALRLDVSPGWAVAALRRELGPLEALALEHLQDPVSSRPALARLCPDCALPLAAGRLIQDEAALAGTLLDAALDVLVVDPAAWGGIEPVLAAAACCMTFGVDLALDAGGGGEIARAVCLHLQTTLRTKPMALQGIASAGVRLSLTRESPLPERAVLAMPGGPGLGLTLDEALVSQRLLDMREIVR